MSSSIHHDSKVIIMITDVLLSLDFDVQVAL